MRAIHQVGAVLLATICGSLYGESDYDTVNKQEFENCIVSEYVNVFTDELILGLVCTNRPTEEDSTKTDPLSSVGVLISNQDRIPIILFVNSTKQGSTKRKIDLQYRFDKNEVVTNTATQNDHRAILFSFDDFPTFLDDLAKSKRIVFKYNDTTRRIMLRGSSEAVKVFLDKLEDFPEISQETKKRGWFPEIDIKVRFSDRDNTEAADGDHG